MLHVDFLTLKNARIIHQFYSLKVLVKNEVLMGIGERLLLRDVSLFNSTFTQPYKILSLCESLL